MPLPNSKTPKGLKNEVEEEKEEENDYNGRDKGYGDDNVENRDGKMVLIPRNF